MTTFRRLLLASLAAVALVAGARAGAQSPQFKVVKTLKVGGDGGWDYLTADPGTDRLYISRGTHVMVLGLDKGNVVGDIPNTAGVHGIAVATGFNRGFTSNGRDTSVTIFDLKTLATILKVSVTGAGPDAILYDPFSKRVFTMNHSGGNSTAIDPATGAVLGTATIGGTLETGVSDEGGTIFVNVEDKNEIVAFDAKTMDVKGHWPLTGCDGPTGLAIDRKHARLFASCSGSKTMDVVDYKSGGRIVATVPICQGTDADAWDEDLKLAFASCGDGTITAVHQDTPDKYSVVQTIPTERGARTMALDERKHRLYTVTAEFGPPPDPPPADGRPRRGPMIPGSFHVLVIEK